MSVDFVLDLPPRRPVQPEFDAPPVESPLLDGEERRHRELLAALQQVGEAVAGLEVPEGVAAPLPAAGPDLALAQALFLDDLKQALESQASLTTAALEQVVERLRTLGRQIVGLASGGSGGGSTGHVIVDSGTVNLGSAVTLDSTALSAIREALTDAELRASPVPVTATDSRGLTQRMFERSPQSGYKLWMDVTSTDATKIWMAEAPDGSAETATVFQGIQVTLDASGNPLGAVKTATGFRWDQRSSASWSA